MGEAEENRKAREEGGASQWAALTGLDTVPGQQGIRAGFSKFHP